MKPGPVDKMVVMSAKPKPKQKTMADGMRSTIYKAYRGELLDPSLLQISEVYAGFTDMACVPLITTMGISSEIPLMNSALGKVQAGSPLSSATADYKQANYTPPRCPFSTNSSSEALQAGPLKLRVRVQRKGAVVF